MSTKTKAATQAAWGFGSRLGRPIEPAWQKDLFWPAGQKASPGHSKKSEASEKTHCGPKLIPVMSAWSMDAQSPRRKYSKKSMFSRPVRMGFHRDQILNFFDVYMEDLAGQPARKSVSQNGQDIWFWASIVAVLLLL